MYLLTYLAQFNISAFILHLASNCSIILFTADLFDYAIVNIFRQNVFSLQRYLISSTD